MSRVLACTSLPSLPVVGLEVLKLTRQPDVSVEQVAKVIETDPALSAKVLKTVNSSLFGLQHRCTTIRRAMGFLGLSAVKSIVLGFSLIESGKNVRDGAGYDVSEHWRRTIYAAAGARTLASVTQACDPEEAFTAAMFQDLGVLAMFTAMGEDYVRAIAQAPLDHAAHTQLEKSVFGYSHAEVGAALAAKWSLPERYVLAIAHHHAPDEAEPAAREFIRVVALGATIALTLARPENAPRVGEMVQSGQRWFKLSADDVSGLLEKVSKASRELGKLFDKSVGPPPDTKAIMEQARDQQVVQQIAIARDVHVLRERNEALARQAQTDALTGAHNRQFFDQASVRLWQEALTQRTPLAVVMADADRFKLVNDSHGHAAGDIVLKELVRRLKSVVAELGNEQSHVCRVGGEEFALLLPGLSSAQAAKLAEAARVAIERTPISLAELAGAPAEISITASFGVAAFTPTAGGSLASFAAMLEIADRLLYDAKKAGRNRVCAAPGSASAAAPSTAPASTKSATARKPARDAANKSPTKVLLIESDPLASKLMIMLLTKIPGVEVEWLTEGSAAYRRIVDAASNPDARPTIIVSDQELPGSGGLALLKTTRSLPQLRTLPFVMLSAITDANNAQRCITAGATACVSKAELAADLSGLLAKIVGEWAQAGKAA